MGTLSDFLSAIARIRAFGVQERSFYPPIANLMTDVGHGLKPKVRCVTELKGVGADHPDAGLFSDDICRRLDDDAIRALKPDRGVIEVKPPSHDARKVAKSEQVGKYLDGYGLVLVATMREFLLVDRGPGGALRELEYVALTSTEDEFWNERACWRNVPEAVWNFTIGGYQILKKWLSYRERNILGRALKADEITEFQRIARRIAALVALTPALDNNYRAAVESHTPWPKESDA